MTQQDDIIQRLRDLRLGVEMDRHNLEDGDAKLAALDSAIALLSKLRAPVADERAAFDLLDTLFTAYENGTPCYEEPDSQGGYLGMALRIDDDTFRACADLLNKHRPRTDAALASAPVAGEAQEHIEQMAVNRYRPVPDGKFSYKVVAGDGTRSLYTGTKDSCLRVAAKLTEAFLDGAFVAAAPQASAEYERGHADGWAAGWDQAIKQPQAAKDGGQQRAGDVADAARYRLAVADCILILRGDAALGRAEWDSKLDNLAKAKGAA